jgi:dipeptidyl aminopeptidase/acylaminoacyl peptidase
VATILAGGVPTVAAGLTFEQLAAIREVGQVQLSPDGNRVAFTLEVPRTIGRDDDGPEWVELWVTGTDGSDPRPYVHGPEEVSAVRFSPNGDLVTYLAKRAGDEHRTLWAIPIDGGESKRIVEFDEAITDYRLSPGGERIAFIAKQPESEARKKARKKGYKQEIFEEDWRPQRLWITRMNPLAPPPPDPGVIESDDDPDEPREFPIEGAVFDVEWTPDGEQLVLAVAPTPLIDDRYMRRRLGLYDVETGERLATIANPGKLGAVAVSPDGRNVALITAADPNDPLQGRLSVAPITGGDPRDLLPDLLGHVSSMAWRDSETLAFVTDVGEETRYAEVDVASGKLRQILMSGEDTPTGRIPLMTNLSLSSDGGVAAFVGESPDHPGELFVMSGDDRTLRRLTDSNPWLAKVELGRQQVYEWKARDGLTLRGVLIRPLDDRRDGPPPLMMIVHGGPEGHVANGWVTSYSRPGQIAATGGYVVFYPNYRGSTGRGVDFSKLGQGAAAGPEFDDLIDAVDALVKDGLADNTRVGVTGSSYGGYATAWCATRYTDRFRAGVMFVGISNKVSKGLTTEIPYEDKMVHTLFDPWTRWDFSLERSPVFYAEQSRTALLIAGGTADTRVHPSQSLQLYRALRLIDETPVRYVRYPGEQHGNRRAAARDDYTRRLMRWMDHFVLTDATAPPPYELDLPDEEDEPED